MQGGGRSRKEDPLVINSTNVFAALGSLKKKKKKKGSEKESLGSSSKTKGKKEAEKKEVFWAPSPLKVKSWADVDEEDDDDYYASMAPPTSAWGNHKEPEPVLEESESEEEGLDEVDDDVEEEHENGTETQVEVQPVISRPSEASVVNKEAERQLSKKELKKKGLEELDAVLAELGYANPQTGGSNDSHGVEQGKHLESNEKIEKKENAPAESKSAKKKKRKDKSSKEVKELSQGPPEGIDAKETGEIKKPEETPVVDVKEKLKKVVSAKKKKSGKEMDAAARAAANEAAARNARLAAAKKKEKNHYNQQPVR